MRKHFIDHSNSSLHKLLVGGIFLFCISYVTAQERKTETLQPGKIPVSQTDTLAVKEQKQDSIASPPSCTSYDYLKIRGITVPFPSICQTISPELFGSRKWLEDKGIGIHGMGNMLLPMTFWTMKQSHKITLVRNLPIPPTFLPIFNMIWAG